MQPMIIIVATWIVMTMYLGKSFNEYMKDKDKISMKFIVIGWMVVSAIEGCIFGVLYQFYEIQQLLL